MDAWRQLHDLVAENTRSWAVRSDIKVTAHGTERGVELTLWWKNPDDDEWAFRRYRSTGKRNVATMRELAMSLWAACDFVESVNPEWASSAAPLDHPDTFLMED